MSNRVSWLALHSNSTSLDSSCACRRATCTAACQRSVCQGWCSDELERLTCTHMYGTAAARVRYPLLLFSVYTIIVLVARHCILRIPSKQEMSHNIPPTILSSLFSFFLLFSYRRLPVVLHAVVATATKQSSVCRPLVLCFGVHKQQSSIVIFISLTISPFPPTPTSSLFFLPSLSSQSQTTYGLGNGSLQERCLESLRRSSQSWQDQC